MTLTKSDLQAIDKIVAKRVEPLEKGQRKIQRDLKTVINSFDTEYLGLKRRVVKIENHLNIQPTEF